jgi:hypothetical protein
MQAFECQIHSKHEWVKILILSIKAKAFHKCQPQMNEIIGLSTPGLIGGYHWEVTNHLCWVGSPVTDAPV